MSTQPFRTDIPHSSTGPIGSGSGGYVPKRVLVTGGAGFIGSHLVDTLVGMGDSVTVIDNLSTGRRTNLEQHTGNAAVASSGTDAATPSDTNPSSSTQRVRFIEADLGRTLQAFGDGEIFDEIYHLAAAVGVRLVVSDPIGSIETNVGQTEALLRFADTRRTSGHPPRVLIASSSEVYGKGTKVPFAEEDDVVYGATTVSRWSYACSKAIDEYLALAYHSSRGLPVVVARFFNTVGPRQVGDYGMVLPRFVLAALENKPLLVHGDGTQSRCFCDVRDVAAVLPRLVRTNQCTGRVFNVGSDVSVTISELAGRVTDTLKSKSEIRNIPYSEAFGPGFEDLMIRRPDLTRIRQTIGFNPTIRLEQTILELADSLSNRTASTL